MVNLSAAGFSQPIDCEILEGKPHLKLELKIENCALNLIDFIYTTNDFNERIHYDKLKCLCSTFRLSLMTLDL